MSTDLTSLSEPVAAADVPPRMESVWSRLWARPLARFFLGVLALLYFLCFAAPWLAPYTESEQLLAKAYHPPSRLVWQDGALYVQRTELVNRATREFRAIPGDLAPVQLWVKGGSYRWLGLLSGDRHLFGVPSQDRLYLLGADGFGRCIFSRLLYGGQISLSIGLLGITITTVIGMILGGVAGYFGGWTDGILMRLTEVLMSIPGLYLVLALRAIFTRNLDSAQIYIMVVVILSFIGWSGMARVIRGMTLALRETPFVQSARALGQHPLKILVRHVLPNTFSYVIVAATLSVPGYILGEAALSFLGLGIQDPQSSWGLMLAQAQNLRVLLSFWWMLLPGALISITVLSFNFLGDALRDVVDPRHRVLH
jgi:peptide/nickel transport system permease protein